MPLPLTITSNVMIVVESAVRASPTSTKLMNACEPLPLNELPPVVPSFFFKPYVGAVPTTSKAAVSISTVSSKVLMLAGHDVNATVTVIVSPTAGVGLLTVTAIAASSAAKVMGATAQNTSAKTTNIEMIFFILFSSN